MPAVILLSHGFQAEYELGFANGLARNGVRVTLVGSDTTLCDRLEASVEFLNLRGSQRPDRTKIAKIANMLRYFVRYLGLLTRRHGTPVHVIGLFSTRSLWVSLLEAWLIRCVAGDYVLTVHNLLPHDRHSPINVWLCRGIYAAAGRYMVHTKRMAAGLAQAFNIDSSRIVVVEHGIDRYRPDNGTGRASMRARLGIGTHERVLLFFGKIARYKGLDILLDAFGRPEARSADRLVVAGMCPDRYLAQALAAQREAHTRREAIAWQEGYVDDADIVPLLHAADVVVLPYRHIDQSGVVFMALATGLPIVATDVGSLADYVGETGGVVVPPNNPEALARGIATVFARGRPVRMVDPEQRFLWTRTVTPILACYEFGV